MIAGMAFPFGSARRASDNTLTPGDPNPKRFHIIAHRTFGAYVAVEIEYPDASNYDGRKIAVYRATSREIALATELDPHFQEKRGPLVPIARFEPTGGGWELALDCARLLARCDGWLR